ncbi:MAG TPA: DMT family transporter [Clostridia bacterium]|nr:DMT family transporter [Clostridia bacterium]
MKSSVRGSLMLMTAAIIWGAAFVAQSVGMDYVGPFTFTGIRFILGGLVLLPIVSWMKRSNPQDKSENAAQPNTRMLLLGGVVCGVILFAASSLQQIGLQTTNPGKAGFVTTLYILIVPLMGLPFGKKVSSNVWVGVFLSAVGLYLLCVQDGFRLERGDAAVLLCALIYSFHIWAIDYLSPRVNGVALSCIQFFVAGILGLAAMFALEKPVLSQILACWLPICYTGFLSCAVAYTFQILGQRETNPTLAALVLSLESVFAALFEWILLKSGLSLRELIGAALMFSAILLAQIPSVRRPSRQPRASHGLGTGD